MTQLVDLFFRASTDQLDKAQDKLKQVSAESKKANGETDSLKSAFEGLSSKAQMGAGAVLAVATAAGTAYLAFAKLRDEAIEAGDRMNDLANRSNVAASRLSLLDAMAKMAGSSAEELVSSAERLGAKLARQDEASGRAAVALKELGINTKDASGEQKSMLQLQEEIILAVDKSANAAKAEGAAIQLLGNEYYKLRTVVKEAAESKGEMYDYMVKTNALISTQLAKNSDEYNDKVAKLGLAFKGVGNSIATWALPGMTKFVDWATKASEAVASLTRRLLGGSTNSETKSDTLSTAESNYAAAVKGMDAASKGDPTSIAYQRASENLKQRTAELAGARRDMLRAMEAESVNRDGVLSGRKDEGNRPAGKDAKEAKATDPTSTNEYKEAMRIAQERQRLRIKEGEDIRKYFLDQEEAAHKAKEATDKLIDAEEERAQASTRTVEKNRISIRVLSQFGATQNDVTLALMDYNIQQAETELATANSGKATQDEIRVLEKKLQVLRRLKGDEQTMQSDEGAERDRQSTFKYGWEDAFDRYKKSAGTAADTARDAFSATAGNMTRALDSFVTTGKLNFKDFTRSIIADLAKIAMQRAIVGLIGMAFGASAGAGGYADASSANSAGAFAKGGAFSNGVEFFAGGGVVDQATAFGMSGGRTGVMGEAGPEAIMPLKRGADGKLGVAGSGGTTHVEIHTPVTITMNGDAGNPSDRAALAQQMKGVVDVQVAKALNDALRPGGKLNQVRR